MYERDFDPAGFAWAVGADRDQSVLGYFRYGNEGSRTILAVCNFTPVPRYNYRIGVPAGGWREIFNSDNAGYGGSDVGNAGVIASQPIWSHDHDDSIELTLPPLGVIFLRHEG